jgi:hypothetical protein
VRRHLFATKPLGTPFTSCASLRIVDAKTGAMQAGKPAALIELAGMMSSPSTNAAEI